MFRAKTLCKLHSYNLLLEDWQAGVQLGAEKSAPCLSCSPGSLAATYPATAHTQSPSPQQMRAHAPSPATPICNWLPLGAMQSPWMCKEPSLSPHRQWWWSGRGVRACLQLPLPPEAVMGWRRGWERWDPYMFPGSVRPLKSRTGPRCHSHPHALAVLLGGNSSQRQIWGQCVHIHPSHQAHLQPSSLPSPYFTHEPPLGSSSSSSPTSPCPQLTSHCSAAWPVTIGASEPRRTASQSTWEWRTTNRSLYFCGTVRS